MNLINFLRDTLVNGGASFNLLTGEYNPKDGYMLAIKGNEVVIPIEKFNHKVLADYIKEHSDMLISGVFDDKFLGSWVDNGNVYLDVSRKFASAYEAIKMGIETKELAIYDNNLKATIPCNELALEQARKIDLINNI